MAAMELSLASPTAASACTGVCTTRQLGSRSTSTRAAHLQVLDVEIPVAHAAHVFCL